MKFILKMRCDGDAFAYFPEIEVADILERVVKRLRNDKGQDLTTSMHDSRGNYVGRFDFTGDWKP